MRIDLFLNDSYKILNLLYENQTVVLDKKVVPLTQSEIGQLQNEEYVSLATRGKYVLSEKAILLIESMRRTDTKLLKDEN